MATAIALYGIDPKTVDLIAARYAQTGKSIRNTYLAEGFDVDPELLPLLLADRRFVSLVKHKTYIILYRDGPRAAVELLIETARDKNASLSHRLRAAELILSRTMPAAQASEATPDDKDLTAMSPDELRSLVDGMQSELAGRARPIGRAPQQIDLDADPTGCFD